MEEPITSIMERLFGDPSWHKIVDKPGVWAWMKQPEETVSIETVPVSTEVNVGAEGESEKFALDALADKVRYYDQLTEAINQAQADRLRVQDEIKKMMGNAKVATLNGVPTFTYAPKQTWRTADIKRDMPHLVALYVEPVTSDVINWDRFFEHHSDAVKEYQTREFRRVSGTRATTRG